MKGTGKGVSALQAVYELSTAVNSAPSLDVVSAATLDYLVQAIGVQRASILIFDEQGAPHFAAWRDLSEAYREAATGYLPWSPDVEAPEPIVIQDAQRDPTLANLHAAIASEGIASLAYIPLRYQGSLLGKLTLCFDQPTTIQVDDLVLVQVVGDHVALAIARTQAEEALRDARDSFEERLEIRTARLRSQIEEREQAENQTRHESRLIRLMQEVAANANEAESTATAYPVALEKVCAYTGWPLGHVYVIAERDAPSLVSTRIWYGGENEKYASFREVTERTDFEAGEGWLGQILDTKASDWLLDLRAPFFKRREAAERSGLLAGFAFPVWAGNRLHAVLEFFTGAPLNVDENLLQAMQFISNQLGSVADREWAQAQLNSLIGELTSTLEQLQRSESLLSEAQAITRMGSWEWDVLEDEISWSDELYRIFGLEGEAFNPSYEGFLSLIHPEDRERVDEGVQGAFAHNEPFEFFHRIVRPDGEVRTLHGRGFPHLDDSGQVLRMYGTGQDVTEEKRVEKSLRASERNYKLLARQLTALNEVGQAVVATLDLDVVFDRVLNQIRPLLGAEGVFILLPDGQENLRFVAANEIGDRDLTGLCVSSTQGVAGQVLQTGKPVWLFGDETREYVYHEIEQIARFQARAILAVPLTVQEHMIGVMEAVHSQSDAFDQGDLALLEMAANWVAIAITNAHNYRAQGNARKMADMLRAANVMLSRTLDLDTILEALLDNADELVGYDQAMVMVRGPAGDLHLHLWRGLDAATVAAYRNQDLAALPNIKHVLSLNAPLIIADISQNAEWRFVPAGLAPSGSWLGVPMLSGKTLLGLFSLRRERPDAYGQQHVDVAQALASQASIAIQNAKLYTQVQASQRRLRQLTAQIVSAQEEERQRVSRELHDEAGQALTALKIGLEMLQADFDQPLPQLDEAIELADQTMEQIRLLAHALRPPALDTFGLSTALESLCRDFGRRTSLKIQFESAQLPPLGDAVSISFYRFVQEALTNVARHAHATEVGVELKREHGNIMASVTDNGTGFDVELVGGHVQAGAGIGLQGMRDRFEMLDGWVSVESTPGEGTSLRACIPYSEEA